MSKLAKVLVELSMQFLMRCARESGCIIIITEKEAVILNKP